MSPEQNAENAIPKVPSPSPPGAASSTSEPAFLLPWQLVRAGSLAGQGRGQSRGPEGTAFASRSSQRIRGHEVASGRWWSALPLSNQLLTLGWGGVLLMTILRIGGPPLLSAGQAALYPYTWEGQRQTCQDNLRAIYQSASLYTRDSDGRFPPLETGSGGVRATWVTALSGRGAARNFQCPSARAIPAGARPLWCSYAMNPVLGGQSAEAVDDPAQTLWLAEAGDKHDVSLLPPFPSWHSGVGRGIESGESASGSNAVKTEAVEVGDLNLTARHGAEANVLYADGHVGALILRGQGAPEWGDDASLWGGSAALRLSLGRIAGRNAPSRELVKRLRASEAGDAGAAGSEAVGATSAARYLEAHRSALQTTSADLLALWRLNRGASASESVDRVGWNLAGAWQRVGDGKPLQSLTRELARRSQSELQGALQAGATAREVLSAAPSEGEAEVAAMIEAPANWKVEGKRTGRYGQTYLRSGLKDVFILCEIGDRESYHPPSPVDWSGIEARLKRKAGTSYRRLKWSRGTLAGQSASVWEYEVDKPGSPRLHKLAFGHSGAWRSTVVACTAPASEFETWRPIFEKAISTFRVP